MEIEEKIDIVVMWVDGNDPKWRQEYNKFKENKGDKRENRFRAWNIFKYFFRGIEKNMNWINKIYFVTYGHIPEWLDIKNPRLEIIKHEDIIEKKFLPVFNSRAIEVNLHKIKGLSEKFIFMNDDFFVLKKIEKKFFFRGNKACLIPGMNAITRDPLDHVLLNNTNIINKYFSKHEILKKDWSKWFSIKLGKLLFRNFVLTPWPQFTGFYETHTATPFFKKSFEEVWNLEEELLLKTTASKFKNKSNLNQYVFKYWQLAKGEFVVGNANESFLINVSSINDLKLLREKIENKSYKIICINDNLTSVSKKDFAFIESELIKSFEKIYPLKSNFEL